jgi:tripartite-type tricarboxylate transporter receptor subunit TctC
LPSSCPVATRAAGTPSARRAGTPAEIVDQLNKAVNAGLADQQFKARLIGLGYTPVASSPAEFGNFIAEETEKWRAVIKLAGIKLE